MELYLEALVNRVLSPTPVASILSPTSVASGADLLPSNLQPNARAAAYRSVIVFGGDTSGLNARIMTGVSTIDAKVLTNVGTLLANVAYVFDLPVESAFEYNFNPTDATTVVFAQIHEIGGAAV